MCFGRRAQTHGENNTRSLQLYNNNKIALYHFELKLISDTFTANVIISSMNARVSAAK